MGYSCFLFLSVFVPTSYFFRPPILLYFSFVNFYLSLLLTFLLVCLSFFYLSSLLTSLLLCFFLPSVFIFLSYSMCFYLLSFFFTLFLACFFHSLFLPSCLTIFLILGNLLFVPVIFVSSFSLFLCLCLCLFVCFFLSFYPRQTVRASLRHNPVLSRTPTARVFKVLLILI
jgi:hypothetical protein